MNRKHFAPFMLMAALFVGCQADLATDPTVSTDATTQGKITLVASAGSEVSTKVAYEDGTGTVSATWEADDAFSVFNTATNAYVGDFKYSGTPGSKSGTFTQVGDFAMESDVEYIAVMPAVEGVSSLTDRDVNTTAVQSNSSNATLGHLSDAVRLKEIFTINSDEPLKFEYEVALIKLEVTLPEAGNVEKITVEEGENSYSLEFSDKITSDKFSTYIAVEESGAGVARDIIFSVVDQVQTLTHSVNTALAFEAGKFYTAKIDLSESGDVSDATDYYTAGYTAPNGKTYSSESEDVQLLTESTIIGTNGVYFLDPSSDDVVYTMPARSLSDIVIVGRYSDKKPKVVATGIQSIGGGADGVIYKNIHYTGNAANYTFNFSTGVTGVADYWVFEDCYLATNTDVSTKQLSYFSNAKCSINNIIFKNNTIEVGLKSNEQATRLININAATVKNPLNCEITNNVIFCNDGLYANGALFFLGNSFGATPAVDLNISNNTIVNYRCSSQGLVAVPGLNSIIMKDNIFYGSSDISADTYLFRYNLSKNAPAIDTFEGNVHYGFVSKAAWKKYHGASTYKNALFDEAVCGQTESGDIFFNKVETDPLAVADFQNGVFTQAAGFEDKGATVK